MSATEVMNPNDIGVLLGDSLAREESERALSSMPFPLGVKWGRIEAYAPHSSTVDTVARFKGLERAIIILWGLDNSDPQRDRETLYVGMSRAKSILYLCGTPAACDRFGAK